MERLNNADSILFRCSSLGYIMTEPLGKSNLEKYNDEVAKLAKLKAEYEGIANKETKTAANKLAAIAKSESEVARLELVKHEVVLSETCKKHLADKYVSAVYGRNKDLQNKYIKKGNAVEEDSITLYSRYKGEMYRKNTERRSNDFITGECDIDANPTDVVDTKSSWDVFTFYRSKVEDLKKMYHWQGMGYIDLYKKQRAIIAYCLVNTPQVMIDDEKAKLWWKLGRPSDLDPNWIKAQKEIDRISLYDDIPLHERVNEVVIERSDADIEKMYQRINVCRKYMNETFFKI